MTTIRTRPYPDGGTTVTGRAATMPPITGPGRPTSASRSTAAAQLPPWRARQPAARHQLSRHEEAQPTNPAPRPAPAAEQVGAGLGRGGVHPPAAIPLSRLEYDHAR